MYKIRCPHCELVWIFKKGGNHMFYKVMSHMALEHIDVFMKAMKVVKLNIRREIDK